MTWSWAALHHWHLKQCRFKMVELWLLPMPEDPRCTLMLLFSFFAGFAGWSKAQKWGFVQWTASVLVLLARKQLISGSTDSLSQIGVLKTKVVIFFLSNNLTLWTMYTSYDLSNILMWAALPSPLIEKINKMCTFRFRTSDSACRRWWAQATLTFYRLLRISQIGPHKTRLIISALVRWWIEPPPHKKK